MQDETGGGRDAAVESGTPRWVKVFGIITLVIVLLVVVLKFAGGGGHGPSRHMPRGDTSGQGSG